MELNENQYTAVAASLSLLYKVDNHFDTMLSKYGQLSRCKVSIDSDLFDNAKFYLDQIEQNLQKKMLAHIDALDAKPKRVK
jgi:hypothetical protein